MSSYETFGRSSQKLRTRNALKAAAGELVASGRRPTVAEVAEAAGISKSTAYRYFPSQELLYAEVVMTAAVGADRQQVHAAADGHGDASARLARVVRADHAFTTKHEHALRAGMRALLLLLESYPEAPLEPSHRVRYLSKTLEPMADRLTAAELRRLVAALALCVGLESTLITQVSCGLSQEESEEVKVWAAEALLRTALREASGADR